MKYLKNLLRNHGLCQVEIYTSMEATKHQAEYIRDGLIMTMERQYSSSIEKRKHSKKVHMMMTINS